MLFNWIQGSGKRKPFGKRILRLGLVLFLAIGSTHTAATARSLVPIRAFQGNAVPFRGLSIAELTARSYGGGQITVDQTVPTSFGFTRYFIHYPSDGLTIYGFMDVPTKAPQSGTFYPVVIALHGYVDPGIYTTLDYTTGYADAIAQAGYLVLHPNFRNYGASDKGPNLLRVGFAIDVLNLLAIVRTHGGQTGPLKMADPARIGLWGHSMGGGVAIRVMTVDPQVRAVVLASPISGDDKLNVAQFLNRPGQYDAIFPEDVFQRASPINFYDRIQAAVSIHQGLSDSIVPPTWSADLCSKLNALQKAVECFTYPGQTHTLTGSANQLFIKRTVAFFLAHL